LNKIDGQVRLLTDLRFPLELSIELDWTGRDSQNIYTFNALMNYARLTGQPPKIRVGANSEDRTLWDPNVDVGTPSPDQVLV
jgi:hypothetical protein